MQLEDWDAMEQALRAGWSWIRVFRGAFQLLVLSEVNSGQFERAARRLATRLAGQQTLPRAREAALRWASAAEAYRTDNDGLPCKRLGPDGAGSR